MTEENITPPIAPTPIDKTKVTLIVIAVILFLVSTFFGYSYKKTSDLLTQTLNSYSSAVSIVEPVSVAGKIVYKTTVSTVHDVRTKLVHDKITTIIKSGCAVGVAMSTKRVPGVYLAPDLFPFGPGNVQVMGLFSADELWGGVAYRLNF